MVLAIMAVLYERNAVPTSDNPAPLASELSERKKLEQDLVATVKELRDVKAALDEHSIVAITDAGGRITYVNDKFCAISQYAREELIGQDHRIINSGHHPKEFIRDLWTTIAQGKVWHGEIKNKAKDGSFYWVDTTIYPFVNEAGKPVQYVAIRTGHHQAQGQREERVAARRRRAGREQQGTRGDCLHGVARSALAAGQRAGLRQTAHPRLRDHRRRAGRRQRRSRTVGKIAAAGRRRNSPGAALHQRRHQQDGFAAHRSLLRYSRLGRVALNLRPLNLNGLLAEIITTMKFQLDEAKAEVRVEPLPVCLADNVQTSQVFANLLDNALKYRHPSRPLRVVVSRPGARRPGSL